MILSGTHQLFVYPDDVNMLDGAVRTTVKKITEAFLVAINVIGLETNTNKTKCMVKSRDINAERSHNIKPDIALLKIRKGPNIRENH